ncbi:FadR/GntR family transcriptional regulator [Caballeronia zhejiangensis]|uniref:FadR/GntR family transcriptional regulator n=1 Tax=Caballeronia zhejiangensis TaxID=871203 RepID=UPI001EF44A0F|nr:FadR/GntR family transcriptional regulator [Caballeronia zhejiangensis]MCG7400268.1 FadR family transcriptional regulator [Caballeronia zhejiangensis]
MPRTNVSKVSPPARAGHAIPDESAEAQPGKSRRAAQEKEAATPLRKTTTVLVNRIQAPKPHDLLADQLREAILRGEISEGETLPPERALVEQTGLSRGAVREALRVLAVEGLVQTRPGRFGGNVVTLPGTESMANSISQFVRGRQLPLRTLHETREALEPALARLAAVHRTEEDVRTLAALHEELIGSVNNFQHFSQANVKWHNAVARASGNELLAGVLYAISYGVAVSTTTEEYDTMDTRNQVIRIHAQINAAIEARNPDLAEKRMRQHIGATHVRATASDTSHVPLSDD